MDEKIQTIMREVTSWDKPSVYNVSITRNDHNTSYYAHATLRGSHHASYETTGESPLEALQELKKVLLSLICPTCGRVEND